MKTIVILLIALMALYTIYFGVEQHMADALDRQQLFGLIVQFFVCIAGILLIRKAHIWTKDLYLYDDDDTETNQ